MTKGIARKGWDLDLKDGLEAENRLNEALRNKKIEVKSDKQAWRTGNVFVETSCRGKPSGISTTEASFWAFEVRTDTFIIIPIDRLIDMVCEAEQIGLKRAGGDYNKSSGVLIPLEWVASYR